MVCYSFLVMLFHPNTMPTFTGARTVPGKSRSWDIYFRVAFIAALVLNVIAIWVTRWLPMGDVGGWIELIDVVGRFGASDTVYADYYVLPSGLEPNSLVVHLGSFLGNFMPSDIAAKVFVTWYVVGVPVGVLMFAKALGRSRWLAFFAAPMVFNSLFNVGVLNFLVAMPLMFMGLARAHTRMREGRLRDDMILAVIFVLIFYSHVLALLMALGMTAPVLLLGIRQRRDLLRFVFLVPTLVLLAIWVVRKYVFAETTADGLALVGDDGLGFVFHGMGARIGQIHEWGMRFFRDDTDEWFVIILGLSWLALMGAARFGGRGKDDKRRGFLEVARERVLEMITFGSIVAFFALPSHMREIELIAERVVVPVLILLTLWPRLRLSGTRVHALVLPVVLAALVYPIAVANKFLVFEREYIGGLPAAIAELPKGSRVAYVMNERTIPLTHMGPLWHIPKALVAVELGGVTNDSFAIRPYCPVQFQPGKSPRALSAQFWDPGEATDWDYVLLRSSLRAPTEARSARDLTLVFEGQGWYLFKVMPP